MAQLFWQPEVGNRGGTGAICVARVELTVSKTERNEKRQKYYLTDENCLNSARIWLVHNLTLGHLNVVKSNLCLEKKVYKIFVLSNIPDIPLLRARRGTIFWAIRILVLQWYETGVTKEKWQSRTKNKAMEEQQQQPANKWSLETAKFLFWSPNEVKRKFWKTASLRSLLTVAPFPKTKSILFEGRGRGACTQART